MAQVKIGIEVLEEALFRYSDNPVKIRQVSVDLDPFGSGYLIFDITGADVPDAPEVSALCSVQTNRAGQRLVTMKFEAVKA